MHALQEPREGHLKVGDKASGYRKVHKVQAHVIDLLPEVRAAAELPLPDGVYDPVGSRNSVKVGNSDLGSIAGDTSLKKRQPSSPPAAHHEFAVSPMFGLAAHQAREEGKRQPRPRYTILCTINISISTGKEGNVSANGEGCK